MGLVSLLTRVHPLGTATVGECSTSMEASSTSPTLTPDGTGSDKDAPTLLWAEVAERKLIPGLGLAVLLAARKARARTRPRTITVPRDASLPSTLTVRRLRALDRRSVNRAPSRMSATRSSQHRNGSRPLRRRGREHRLRTYPAGRGRSRGEFSARNHSAETCYR